VTAPVIPTTPEELAEAISDRKIVSEILNSEDRSLWPKFMTAYADANAKRNPEILRELSEQQERQMVAWLKENGQTLRRPDMRPASTQDVRNSRQTGNAYMPETPGKALNGKFATMMDFLSVVGGDPRDAEVADKRKLIKNAMSSTDPSSGGFLIPEEFRTEMLEIALSTAVVRSRATVIPMSTLRVAIPTVDSTSNASSVYGGIVGYWTEEGSAMVQSQPRFGRVGLEAKKLTAYTEIPNELISDSNPSAEAFVRQAFPQAIAWFEDVAFLTGSGAGEPVGVFNPNNGALLSQAAVSGQATRTILWENLVGMYSRMLPTSLNDAVWVVAPDTLPELLTTALSVGTGGAPIGMANFSGTSGPTMTLLGRPVIISEKVNALSSVTSTQGGDVNFVDFRQYLIGDRMSMAAELSTDYKFANDVTAFRFIERVDGRPWMQSAITPKNGGPTLSAYVQLGGR
jgi:HK97 family phage major capsid protein